MNSLALSGWRQLRAALPGHHTDHDTASEVSTLQRLEDTEVFERQRTALATLSLGWGDCFPTAAGFFSWQAPNRDRWFAKIRAAAL
jgi:hypothetical protein